MRNKETVRNSSIQSCFIYCLFNILYFLCSVCMHSSMSFNFTELHRQVTIRLISMLGSVNVCDGSVMHGRPVKMFPSISGSHCPGKDEQNKENEWHTPYHVHYRGILSSSSPAETSFWGSAASERTSGPGSDTSSARTQFSVQSHNKNIILHD